MLRTKRANAHPAIREVLDLVQREAIHIDEMRRTFDLELHEIEQVGAARDEFRVRVARGGRRCRSGRGRLLVAEGPHALTLLVFCATSVMASTIFEYAPHRQMFPLMRSRISPGVA